MSEQAETETKQESGPFSDSIGRVWSEIKQISKQVEHETRKSGRVARLKLDLRSLRREEGEVHGRLGKAVYAARQEHGDSIALSEVEGFGGGVAALDTLSEQITTKEAEIEQLRQAGVDDEQPLETSDEVLFSHYRALASKESCDAYFNIRPKESEQDLGKVGWALPGTFAPST